MQNDFKLNNLEAEVVIDNEAVQLKGILALPPTTNDLQGIVVFAHGSGSGRFSPRNNFVARELQKVELGTLLLDLLTEPEALDRGNVFDIELLSNRLRLTKRWLNKNQKTQKLKVGYFGASTGAGAALVAAANDPQDIFAIVSRGGRPDLAGEFLSLVLAPTLLLVGGNDGIVIDLNHEAYEKLNCKKEIKIIPGATHLFEEPGTLEAVAAEAAAWFVHCLKE